MSDGDLANVNYQFMTNEERTKLGYPTNSKEYDTDAEMIAQVLRDHFVNTYVKAFNYAEMDGYFVGQYPWFFRICITVLGKDMYQDIGFEEWYEVKDKRRIIHLVTTVMREFIMNYIEGKGLRYTK